MNKIEELEEVAKTALAAGVRTVEINPSDLKHLTTIAKFAYEKFPAAAESRARDFANFWMYDLRISNDSK